MISGLTRISLGDIICRGQRKTSRRGSLHAPTSIVLYGVLAGGLVGFVTAFWLGDPAVRFLARVFGWIP